jgi:hypothetical protein
MLSTVELQTSAEAAEISKELADRMIAAKLRTSKSAAVK